MTALIIASVAFVVSICINAFLFGLQARNMDKIPLSVSALIFLSYFIWTIYSIITADWALIAGQGFGMLTSGIILGRILYQKLK